MYEIYIPSLQKADFSGPNFIPEMFIPSILCQKSLYGRKKELKSFQGCDGWEARSETVLVKKIPFFFQKSGYFHSWSSSAYISNASFVNGKSHEIFAFARFAAPNCRQDVAGCKQLSCDWDFCYFRGTLAPRGRANIPPRECHPQSCPEPFVAESGTPTGNDPTHEVTTELHKFS